MTEQLTRIFFPWLIFFFSILEILCWKVLKVFICCFLNKLVIISSNSENSINKSRFVDL